MSDYTPTGNPATSASGSSSDIRSELTLIQTAVNSKADETNAVLVTPNLGTPSAGVLTNCTGLPVAGGGTGRATSTTAYALLAAGTTATGAHQTLAAGATTEILVGGGASALPVWTAATGSGAPVRATSPTLTTPNIGVATATSVNGLLITQGADNVLSSTAVGAFALDESTNGAQKRNSAFGTSACTRVTTGVSNSAFGASALSSLITSSFNSAFGDLALQSATAGMNTAFGAAAGNTLTTGSNDTFVGYDAQPSAVGASNEITLGNSSIATLRCQVTSITALSDIRDKTDIVPLTTGLSTVMALNPVRFTWNMRDGGKVGVKDSGFIAQDLQTVDDEWLRLVYAENPEKLEASYGRLIPVLVKAIQELKAEVDLLRNQPQ